MPPASAITSAAQYQPQVASITTSGVRAGVSDRCGEVLWSVVDLAVPELLAVLIQDDDHRPAPVKINSHVMSHDGASSHRVVKASPSLTRAHERGGPLALHGITSDRAGPLILLGDDLNTQTVARWRPGMSRARRCRPVSTVRDVISREASLIRASIVPEVVEPGWTLGAERSGWEEATRSDRLAVGTTEHEDTVGGRPVLWIVPDDTPTTDAIIVYVHGGGLTAGSPRTHRAFASRLAAGCRVRLLLVDYRLLPESAFPAPLEDVIAVVEELISTELAPTRRIVLAGDSSGAGLAISAACALRDRSVDAIAGIVSLSGAFDATLSGESIDAGHDPQLSRPVLERWQQTISAAVEPSDPLMSPLFGELHDLAPTLLLCGSDDVWLSDSLRLADKLAAAGSSVLLHEVDGMWHVWPMDGDFPEAEMAVAQIVQFIDSITI